ncbi:MAG: S-layer homology domain-containing protein, partial [Chloroflexota bacterium]|nr:S-layer homology domain-containing protein [Chloroflexota bacterium]
MFSLQTRRPSIRQAAASMLGGLALLCLLPTSAGAGHPDQGTKLRPSTQGVPASPLATLATTERVSLANDASQGNAASGVEGIPTGVSADGRFVAFYSFASNLVPGDTNGHPDIFLRDRQAGTTTLVSHGYDGSPADQLSTYPSISADGNFVAYQSAATNLVPGDTNSTTDVFIYNRQTGVNTRIATPNGSFGTEDPRISGDGRYVVFHTYAALLPADTNGSRDIYLVDLVNGGVELISAGVTGGAGNGHSFTPYISHDGRYVAFHSGATNLASGDANNQLDVFVRDRVGGATVMASIASDGTQGNSRSYNASVSDDGRYVAFESLASNLVPGDTNSAIDIFVRDVAANTITRASVASDGSQAQDTRHSTVPNISGDGRYVAFQSDARLAPEDTTIITDVYLRDLRSNTTELISEATTRQAGNSYSHKPQVSRDGTYVVFGSYASNLVPGDTNSQRDVFLRDRSQRSCTAVFSDVQPGSTFYQYVMCLACRNIISGYSDGTFRPGSPVTRGQLSKIVANAANYQENYTGQTFEDVPVGSTFHQFVERLASRSIIAGYPCGGPGEPCVSGKPYFRPNANVTRGQTAKIVASAANLPAPPAGRQTFKDVPQGSTFWTWIEALAATNAIAGYSCGGENEPCVPTENRPYFRPNDNVTRGQSSKIVSNT